MIERIPLRKKVYQLLDTGNNDLTGKLIDWFLMALITVNVIAVIMETIPSFYIKYALYLYWLELFSVIIFSVEYILRLWSCVEDPKYQKAHNPFISRLKYSCSPMALIDLFAIAPFYLAFLFTMDLRFLRVLRLLRIFKLTRYSAAMTTLLKVLKEEISSFMAAIFIMLVIMIIAASGIYLLEKDLQPEIYGSIPSSMWWSIVTLTTVGYGDAYPVTVIGKIFAAIIMVAGVGLVALPTGILASSFSDNLHRGREKMTQEISDALADGVIDTHEEEYLEEVRKNLGLTEERFAELKKSLLNRTNNLKGKNLTIEEIMSHNDTKGYCPHCGKKI